MQVSRDYICEHGMPQPWATCTECMLLPHDEQPVPRKPAPEPAAERAKAGKPAKSSGGPRPKKAPRSPAPRLPRHIDDQPPELTGSCDLSYEVPEQNVPFHISGPDHDWLAISTLPARLRANGWVYLQVGRSVIARARVRGVGYRDRRWTQEPTETASDAGAGPTLELHPNSWERLRTSLGPEGDVPIPGYRYLHTGPDDSVQVAEPEDSPHGTT